MGCCGKKRVYTAHDPFIVGEPEGDPVEVIATLRVMGFAPNERVWAKGSGLQVLLDHGWLRLA